MHGLSRYFLYVALFFISIDCFSQTPLTIDDIFTANDRYRVNFGVNYFNDSDFQPLTNFRSNTDIIDTNFGLAYGYTKNTELSINLSHSYIQERLSQFGNRATNDTSGTKQANFGVSHKISADNNTPALIGLFRVGYLSNPTWDEGAFSGTLGLVTYRSYDPILLSMSVLAQDTQEFQVNGDSIKQGMRVSLNPAISFAINSHITLTSGLKMQWQQGQKINNRRIDINTTKTNLEVGLGYHWNEDLSISLNTNVNLSEDSGSNVSINIRYKFDDPL